MEKKWPNFIIYNNGRESEHTWQSGCHHHILIYVVIGSHS